MLALWVLLPVVCSGALSPGIITVLDTRVTHEAVTLRAISEVDFTGIEDFSSDHGSICASLASGDERARAGGRDCNYEPPTYVSGVNLVSVVPMSLSAMGADPILYRLNETWAYSCSWGSGNDGARVTLLPKEFERGLAEGTSRGGAAGNGSIYIWSTGNGGETDDCGVDGYNSNPYILGMTEVTPAITNEWTPFQDFNVPHYPEHCSSVFGALMGDPLTVYWKDGACMPVPKGSSIAAAKMAPVVVKALELNPSLRYRDFQHLAVETAVLPEVLAEGTNAAGVSFHSRLGFGVISPGAFIARAAGWAPVPASKKCETVQGNAGSCNVSAIEWAVLSFRASPSNHRGGIHVLLTSPAGTPVMVLRERPADAITGPDSFKIHSNRFWGEDPKGNWTVAFFGTKKEKWSLSIIGT